MDWFSRRLLWLELGAQTKCSRMFDLFLDTVRQIKGIPKMIGMDNGSENGLIGDMQTLLRLLNDEDSAEPTCVLEGSGG